MWQNPRRGMRVMVCFGNQGQLMSAHINISVTDIVRIAPCDIRCMSSLDSSVVQCLGAWYINTDSGVRLQNILMFILTDFISVIPPIEIFCSYTVIDNLFTYVQWCRRFGIFSSRGFFLFDITLSVFFFEREIFHFHSLGRCSQSFRYGYFTVQVLFIVYIFFIVEFSCQSI